MNHTTDDLHSWLTPLEPGGLAVVRVQLDAPATLGLLRVWNYNKSRIHSFRGAREVTVTLDGQLIFAGEIRKAPGVLEGAPQLAETIAFCDDEGFLDAVDEYDRKRYLEAGSGKGKGSESDRQGAAAQAQARPPTSEAGTGAGPPQQRAAPMQGVPAVPQGAPAPTGRKLRIEVLSTWGDEHYVGLNGLQVLGGDGRPLAVGPSALSAHPRDLASVDGFDTDVRTLDKLVDGTAQTTEVSHMWLAPFQGTNWLGIDLGPDPVAVSGVRIWNYNKSTEDACRGVRHFLVYLDGVLLTPPDGVSLRKAPGTATIDFGQTLLFVDGGPAAQKLTQAVELARDAAMRDADSRGDHNHLVQQDFATPLLPVGYTLMIVILSTHGDASYVGLNGIEIVQHDGRVVSVPFSAVAADPDSVNVLPGASGDDPRTPDKLLNGVNNTWEGAGAAGCSWQSPLLIRAEQRTPTVRCKNLRADIYLCC